jgi:hypothetical protein
MGSYKSGRSKDTSHYFPPEIMPIAICAACLGVALKESPEVKELYDEIVECYKLPGLQQIFDKLTEELPEGTELLKEAVNKSGLDINKPPDMENAGIPQMRDTLSGIMGVISDYTDKYTPWIMEGKARNRDLSLILQKISRLIRIGFNNKKDQAQGIYKITEKEALWLGYTIWLSALFKNCKLMLQEFENLKAIKIGGKVYDFKDIVSDNVTSRVHRRLTQQYKTAKFLFVHDHILERMAYRWYQCRVAYSGPEEYAQKLQLDGLAGDPANLLNEIEDCDIALGYPRQSKKD